MSELNFARVRALLFDPAYMNRQTTIGALQTLGFVDVEPVARPADLEEALANQRFQVMIAELQGQDDQVCDIIRKMRHKILGHDPFLVTILTTWDLNADIVRAVVNCGADDLLARPYTIAQIRQRITAVALNRKPFVVTADYVGPSRRAATRDLEEDELFAVPNALRARAAGESEPADAGERAWGKVLRWKAVRLGRQLEATARLLNDAALQGDAAAAAAMIDRAAGVVSDLNFYTAQSEDPAYINIANECAMLGRTLARRKDGAEGDVRAVQENVRKIADRVRVLRVPIPASALQTLPEAKPPERQATYVMI